MELNRRQWMGAAVGVAAATRLLAAGRIDRSRISAISDEIAASPEEAIAFAKQYGLQWLELRQVPGGKQNYFYMPEPELKVAAQQFADNGIRISFLNTNLLKFTLPGTELASQKNETPEVRERRLARDQAAFDRRMEDLRKCIRSAQILKMDKVRVFTFLRVAEPENVFARIAEALEPMARYSEREGVRLLIENESSCNVATCAEAAAMLKLLPMQAIGLNWDALNGLSREEPFPTGYGLLPKKRILNVQIKGKSVLEKAEHLDWTSIVAALDRDGYAGQLGLETHYFDGTKIEKSHASMKEILKMVGSSAT